MREHLDAGRQGYIRVGWPIQSIPRASEYQRTSRHRKNAKGRARIAAATSRRSVLLRGARAPMVATVLIVRASPAGEDKLALSNSTCQGWANVILATSKHPLAGEADAGRGEDGSRHVPARASDCAKA